MPASNSFQSAKSVEDASHLTFFNLFWISTSCTSATILHLKLVLTTLVRNQIIHRECHVTSVALAAVTDFKSERGLALLTHF